MAKTEKAFSTGQAVRLTGVPVRTLDYWARSQFIAPSIAQASGTGTDRKYSFGDLVALSAARQLRQVGVTTQALHPIIPLLRRGINPLKPNRLVVTEAAVKFVSTDEELLSALRKKDQPHCCLVINLSRIVSELQILCTSPHP